MQTTFTENPDTQQEYLDAITGDIKSSLIQFVSERGHGKSQALKAIVKGVMSRDPSIQFMVFDPSTSWYASSPTRYRQRVTIDTLRRGTVSNMVDCVYEIGGITKDQRRELIASFIKAHYSYRYTLKMEKPEEFEKLPWICLVIEEANVVFDSKSLLKSGPKEWAAPVLNDFVSVGRNFKMTAFLVATAEEGEISPSLRRRSRHIYGRVESEADLAKIRRRKLMVNGVNLATFLNTEIRKYHFMYLGSRLYGPVMLPDSVKSPAEDYVSELKPSGEPSWWSQFWLGFTVTLLGFVMLLKYFHVL